MMLAAVLSWQDSVPAADNDLADFDSSVNDRQHPRHEWLPVSGVYLDEMRGGFDIGSGLKVSFGIRREVYLNENRIASTNLNVGDINGSASGQAQAIDTAHTLQLIQNGSGNHFDTSSMSQSATSLVIQNTLSGQDIRSLTIIDAKTNGLELFKDLNMQSALTEAIGQSVGVR